MRKILLIVFLFVLIVPVIGGLTNSYTVPNDKVAYEIQRFDFDSKINMTNTSRVSITNSVCYPTTEYWTTDKLLYSRISYGGKYMVYFDTYYTITGGSINHYSPCSFDFQVNSSFDTSYASGSLLWWNTTGYQFVGLKANGTDIFPGTIELPWVQIYQLTGSRFLAGDYQIYNGEEPLEPPVCDFEISPYPADPGTTLTLNDLSTGDPNGYGWMVLPPIGPWDNESLGIASDAYYTLGQFGQYTFAHEVHNAGGTVQCSYDYWSGTNYTAFNVTPTLVGNLTTNITATNISGQFAPLNLTLIDKPFFKNQLDNMTYFGNYSSAWTGFIDNMTESVNVTFNEVEARINPFNFLTDIIMNSHNLFVVIFIPLLGYVSFPLAITSAVINIIPQPIQLLISLGLLVDLFFLVLRGPD